VEERAEKGKRCARSRLSGREREREKERAGCAEGVKRWNTNPWRRCKLGERRTGSSGAILRCLPVIGDICISLTPTAPRRSSTRLFTTQSTARFLFVLLRSV